MFGFGNRSTMTRGKISDPHWAVISLFLPAERGRGCRPAHDNRRFFDGMMWILRTGSPWRDLPEEFGNWNSIYQRFRRWCQAGVFDALLEALVELGITDDWTTQMVDSTSVRGHSQAAGAKRMARPVGKWLLLSGLNSLHKRIRPSGKPLAKMESRASWSS